MKSFILLIMLTSFFSCAKEKTQFRVDPELMPYYQSFVYEGKIRGQDQSTNDLILEFGDAKSRDNEVLAYCGIDLSSTHIWFERVEYFTPKIVVDKESFDSLSEIERRTLIFHEMGHCILKRNHNKELNEYQYVKSIMYPYLITDILGIFYDNVESYYIDELFNPNSPSVNPSIVGANNSKTHFQEFTLSSKGCDNSTINIEELKTSLESKK